MNKIFLLKNLINPYNLFRFLNAVLNNKKNSIFSDEKYLKASIDWLLTALSDKGGFLASYSLIKGWEKPYPETTGYIIPTLLNFINSSDYRKNEVVNAIRKSGEWLISIQNEDGSFNEVSGIEPIVFDSGQILFGLIAMYEYSGEKKYIESAKKTAMWLCAIQDENGYWQKNDYKNLRHAYSTRVAWALLLMYNITGDSLYKDKAEKNLNWVINQQQKNGWFNYSSFFDEEKSVVHTIGYVVQGLLESGKILNNQKFIDSAKKTADILLELNKEDIINSFYNKNWKPVKKSKCLTGLGQMGVVWLRLFEFIGDKKYFNEAIKVSDYIKSVQDILTRDKNLMGAVSGSYPIWGDYFPFAYPNWAVKFFMDFLLLKQKIENKISIKFYQG